MLQNPVIEFSGQSKCFRIADKIENFRIGYF